MLRLLFLQHSSFAYTVSTPMYTKLPADTHAHLVNLINEFYTRGFEIVCRPDGNYAIRTSDSHDTIAYVKSKDLPRLLELHRQLYVAPAQ